MMLFLDATVGLQVIVKFSTSAEKILSVFPHKASQQVSKDIVPKGMETYCKLRATQFNVFVKGMT